MYTFLMMALIGAGLWLAFSGGLRRRFGRLSAGVLLAGGSAFFFWFMGFWGEMLWFQALGYSQRFWEVFIVQGVAAAAGLLLSAGLIFAFTLETSAEKGVVRYAALGLVALAGATWGASSWEVILRFIHAAPTEINEPIFGLGAGFYLFELPLFNSLAGLLLLTALLALAVCAVDAFASFRNGANLELRPQGEPARLAAVYRSAAFVLLVLALRTFLERYQLMFSQMGAVSGPGWTDVKVRLPALTVMAAVLLAAALVLFIPWPRARLIALFEKRIHSSSPLHAYVFGGSVLVLFGLQLLLTSGLPAIFQRLRVEPNEITFEKPYIAHNIRLTRHGFGLQKVEEREYPATDNFNARTVARNPTIFENIRLWDWRALDAVYKQFQEIRLYYEFEDVDVDRYSLGDTYRQVMVSAREMELANLPEQSQTFVNRRFKYTHGYGITMTNVSEFTPQGLPEMLIRDIPPKSSHPGLAVEQPQIYYGELTRTPAVVNTREMEFDYPRGEENAYIRYPGQGGVALENLWRKFLFGWKFDGLRLFLSEYPTSASRIMFHRQIEERVRTLAPFLEFDDDPYIVLADGRLYWIIDAYTTSDSFPYSEPFVPEGGMSPSGPGRTVYPNDPLSRFQGQNYVRNAGKAVVDAFEGTVDFYIFEAQDPLIRTWQRIFPDMFKAREAMPAALRAHVRYPVDMLLLQGLVYAKYHMTDPTVFYNQEDLWVRATEKYYDQVQPVEPYYIMWSLPGSEQPQFVLMLPFTPKNRQVAIGWIAGMCDGDNYGRFLAYKFPKEKRVLGPQQVETKIDQDRFLSGQLTLWDQRGSRVIRGNVLAIPVAQTLLYVEPIYLQAETAAYPELRLVALMHNDNLSYAQTFDQALEGLLGDTGRQLFSQDETPEGPGATPAALVRQAADAFDGYLEALGGRRFEAASQALDQLQSALQNLSGRFAAQPEATREPSAAGI
ncbi:MAG: UPF0182 family protein, partial [Desulfobacterales bacterium]